VANFSIITLAGVAPPQRPDQIERYPSNRP
jgi:hypothetical protein